MTFVHLQSFFTFESMKTNLILYFLVIFLISSCGPEKEKTEEKTTNNDSISKVKIDVDTLILIEEDLNRPKIEISELLSKTDLILDRPINFDSTFIADYVPIGEEEEYNLSYKEANYLKYSFAESPITDMASYDINTFVYLDSMLKEGGYEEYQNNLDLGQARYSQANVIGKVKINSQTMLIVWSTDYATYEACPYGEGTCVFGTVFTNEVATNTLLLAETSSGGDAPVWGATNIKSELVDSSLTLMKVSVWGEEDYDSGEEIIEEEKEKEEFVLTAYGFKKKN